MRQFKPKDEELLLFRAEAAEILQVKDLDPIEGRTGHTAPAREKS